jgi:hypothetical protein
MVKPERKVKCLGGAAELGWPGWLGTYLIGMSGAGQLGMGGAGSGPGAPCGSASAGPKEPISGRSPCTFAPGAGGD